MIRSPSPKGCTRTAQGGAALIVTLLMLIAVLMLGLSAAQLALQTEKASRNDRDRSIAFEAAEAALKDAELDIEKSPDENRSRSEIFSKNSARSFPDDEDNCGMGEKNISLGLCAYRSPGKTPAWLLVDFDDASPESAQSVPFGRFTGRRLQVGAGNLPSRLPRYVIELMSYNRQGESAERRSYFYRITAVGYGPRGVTQVMLQAIYRKES